MIHKAYFESRILAATPLELVRLLYQGAIDAVRKARLHLEKGEIVPRSDAITKAMTILAELSVSLNPTEGGEISRNLARLYDYMQRRLLEANLKQADEPLAEVLGLLTTLAEAWDAIGPCPDKVYSGRAFPVPQDPTPYPGTNRFQEVPPGGGSEGWTA